MNKSLSDDRIVVYRIPANTVRWILAHDSGRPIMADATMVPGLYIRDPFRSVEGRDTMYLVPFEHEAMFYSYEVLVSDVAPFAVNYVPETDHLSCPSSEPAACAGSAAGGFSQDTEGK